MPVWQQFYEQHKGENFEILSVAMDAQGPEKPRPFVEKAAAHFTTVVDEENLLGQLYGFKAVPNGYLIDEQGVVRYKKLGGFDIRREETARVVEQWVGQSGLLDETLEIESDELGFEHSEANAHFLNGIRLYRNTDIQGALAEWRKGAKLEPDNWVIRKQIWAIENPDKFYAGDVDYGWQKEQVEKGL